MRGVWAPSLPSLRPGREVLKETTEPRQPAPTFLAGR